MNIKKSLHYDQIGLIPERWSGFNIHKSINVIIVHVSKLKDINHTVTWLNDEEAFAKIQHDFMLKVMKALGIDGAYFRIMKAIY